MPQMSPLSWLILFIFFTLTLITSNVINYFSALPKPSSKKSTTVKTSTPNWKWL
uniref:ATP synthase F0 subunit 8 n=1 Tax=Exostira schroederi TaxID=2969970 RepID=UPI002176BFEC|nr:ATP synthase F0 subunit 8 [Exostira schroederi]UUL71668.1 ATP synthase F0 subunit 8 [Exostira schroederi]